MLSSLGAAVLRDLPCLFCCVLQLMVVMIIRACFALVHARLAQLRLRICLFCRATLKVTVYAGCPAQGARVLGPRDVLI